MAVRIMAMAMAMTVCMPGMRMGAVGMATMRMCSFATVVSMADCRKNQHSSNDRRNDQTATDQNPNRITAEHGKQLTLPQTTFPHSKKPRSEFSEDFTA